MATARLSCPRLSLCQPRTAVSRTGECCWKNKAARHQFASLPGGPARGAPCQGCPPALPQVEASLLPWRKRSFRQEIALSQGRRSAKHLPKLPRAPGRRGDAGPMATGWQAQVCRFEGSLSSDPAVLPSGARRLGFTRLMEGLEKFGSPACGWPVPPVRAGKLQDRTTCTPRGIRQGDVDNAGWQEEAGNSQSSPGALPDLRG